MQQASDAKGQVLRKLSSKGLVIARKGSGSDCSAPAQSSLQLCLGQKPPVPLDLLSTLQPTGQDAVGSKQQSGHTTFFALLQVANTSCSCKDCIQSQPGVQSCRGAATAAECRVTGRCVGVNSMACWDLPCIVSRAVRRLFVLQRFAPNCMGLGELNLHAALSTTNPAFDQAAAPCMHGAAYSCGHSQRCQQLLLLLFKYDWDCI